MYLWLKLIHVAAVVMFLGNITTGLFWHRHAERTRDPKLLAHTMEGIIRSDRWFTVPGVFAIIIAGVATAMIGKLPILRTPWILWSLVLFAIAGVVFVARVGPLQRRMLELARSPSFEWDAYQRLARSWELWGAIALLTPIAALALMVLKPIFAR